MIITIDGPTASGKSTTAQHVAQQLGFYYINSGLLFRALAYVSRDKADHQLANLIAALEYHYNPAIGYASITYEGKEITTLLRTPAVSQAASVLAIDPEIRTILIDFQRMLARKHDVVVEGRDAGSVVFPDATYKFFLTASQEIRAQRWRNYQMSRGVCMTAQEALHDIAERDNRDMQRAHAPLVIPQGARVIDNSNLSTQETVQKIIDSIIFLH